MDAEYPNKKLSLGPRHSNPYSISSNEDGIGSHRSRLFPSVRLGMLILMFFGCMLNYATFYILNYSFVCMIDPKYLADTSGDKGNVSSECSDVNANNASNDAASAAYNGSFPWDKTEQSTILAGESWGSIWFIFAAGYFMDKYGARYLFGFANLLLGIVTVMIPFISPFGWQWCFIARILQGIGMLFAWPATFVLAGTWFPPHELGIAIAASAAGFEIGGMISEFVSGIFCGTEAGWPLSFYLFGTMAIIYAVVWVAVYRDTIDNYVLMSRDEKYYIAGGIDKKGARSDQEENEKKQFSTPWKSMFTSLRLLSLTIVNMTGGYAGYFITDYIPQYLDTVLHIDNPTKSGLYSALPFLAALISAQICGPLSDWVETKISRTASLKIFSAIAIVSSCITLGVIPLFSCKTSGIAVAMFSLSFFCYGISIGGYTKNIGQLAPTYTGMVAGIATTALYVGGILAPYVTAAVTKNNSPAEWHTAIFITVGISLVGLLQFLILASGEVQKWDPTYEIKDRTLDEKKNIQFSLETFNYNDAQIIKF